MNPVYLTIGMNLIGVAIILILLVKEIATKNKICKNCFKATTMNPIEIRCHLFDWPFANNHTCNNFEKRK